MEGEPAFHHLQGHEPTPDRDEAARGDVMAEGSGFDGVAGSSADDTQKAESSSQRFRFSHTNLKLVAQTGQLKGSHLSVAPLDVIDGKTYNKEKSKP